MAMADFNKSNPFIIIMRKRSGEVNQGAIQIIKTFIISSLWMVLMSIADGLILQELVITIVTIIFILFEAFSIVNVLKGSAMMDVNNIVYGDHYSVIDINNEDVLKIIEQMDYIKGQMSYIINSIVMNSIVITSIYVMLLLLNKI